jgi:hypothetical protein
MKDVCVALGSLLSQTGEERFNVALDGLLSAVLHLDEDDLRNLDYPLAFVRVDVGQLGFEVLSETLTKPWLREAIQFGDFESIKVKAVALKKAEAEILVTFEPEISSRVKTTHLYFRQEEGLNCPPPEEGFLECYERMEDGVLLSRVRGKNENIGVFRVKEQNCADLLLDYLQRILLIHIRHPIMELYRRLNEKVA